MRAAVLYPGGTVVVEDREVPAPAPGDVLVRVAAVGVCGSDAHYLRHGRIGDYIVDGPIVLGHEASGVVVGVGDGVERARIGQRVSIEPQRPDPVSAESLRGEYNLCPHMRFYATPPVDGALAEFVTIGAAFAHPVPDSVSDTAAALLEPLSVGLAAVRKAAIGPGAAVLVAGAGPVGLLVAQVAHAAGATRIVVSDVMPGRREQAERLGATETRPADVDPGAGYDAFVDASGAPSAVRSGIRAVRPGGRVVLVGMGADTMELPVSLIQNRELSLTGVFRYANTWHAAIELAATGRVRLDAMVTGRFGLDQTVEALNADRTPGAMKAVVFPGVPSIDRVDQ
ncbi:NAD(P)-dependent alcohol dehydrogenase [Tsukamurella sp. 8F]|uniref:NAD(P)-dependent alcohol dehydrogenase n=1 Tax=unclassified Tsukamurella TaxID=2633480 RepID=UPI0023B91012|nr:MULTISPECIES: NAD(P)-dependent alcohol dehydrogenase [unclassified Tsukamurella]MDF0528689.1 NAD(P)-dependent alcohol dehydrogenase [Tsukamurella sp. 8J]MDF0585651.1 NAD(P)-dependent alcohol dehydrogenase [Tsukamurella sp. 8F]